MSEKEFCLGTTVSIFVENWLIIDGEIKAKYALLDWIIQRVEKNRYTFKQQRMCVSYKYIIMYIKLLSIFATCRRLPIKHETLIQCWLTVGPRCAMQANIV